MGHARAGAALLALHVWLGAALLAAGSRAETLRVGAASSLREPIAAIARSFEAGNPGTQVAVSYGASSLLAAQLRAGAPLDVLLLADPVIADRLARQGDIGARATFARNELVVVVRDPSLRIDRPSDLVSDGVDRIAIPEHVVPVGRYARLWLERHALVAAVEARAVYTQHARATLTAVDQGHVDLAIVYASDARLARNAHVAYRIPPDEQPAIAYVAVVAEREPPSALARDWLAFLTGASSQAVLRAAGFAAPDVPSPP